MYKTVAFIPVRGGSKSIPLKNIKEMAGRPLVYWVIKAACDCKEIDKVFVSTDSMLIEKEVLEFGLDKVEVVGRSAYSAIDTAPTEFVMLEFADHFDFDNIVLIQATSPMLTSVDLSGGIQLYKNKGVDSVLSVVRQKRFVWERDDHGYSTPVNYDMYSRPRRQEFDGYLVENGAFYITSKKCLIESRNRISGKICAYEMPEESYYEIDEFSDWIIVESLLKRKHELKPLLNVSLGYIKLFLTDCDGCLTDGGMYYSEQGDELKKFNTKDGYAFQILREKGIITGIITGEDRNLNQRRSDKLHIDELIQQARNKKRIIEGLCKKYSVSPEQVVYVGDDLADIEAMRFVGISFAPADAVSEVQEVASIVTKAKGGRGVIREIVDFLCRNEE